MKRLSHLCNKFKKIQISPILRQTPYLFLKQHTLITGPGNKSLQLEKKLKCLTQPFLLDVWKHLGNYIKEEMITHLNLSQNALNLSNLKSLAFCLKGSPLHYLDLSQNFIGNKGLLIIAQCLQDTNLKTIVLDNNLIDDQGVIPFAVFTTYSILESVSLNNNHITTQGSIKMIQYFKGNQIRHLLLSDNKLSTNTAELICALEGTHIIYLDISLNQIDLSSLATLGSSIQKTLLSHLDLSKNNISPKYAKQLINSLSQTHLLWLNLGFNPINTKGALNILPHLTSTHIMYLNLENWKNISPIINTKIMTATHKNFIKSFKICLLTLGILNLNTKSFQKHIQKNIQINKKSTLIEAMVILRHLPTELCLNLIELLFSPPIEYQSRIANKLSLSLYNSIRTLRPNGFNCPVQKYNSKLK